MVEKKIFYFFFCLFFIQSVFSMEVDTKNTEAMINVFDEDFFISTVTIYIDICGIKPEMVTPEFSQLLRRLISEVLFFDGARNIYELYYFFALSKKFYEKIKAKDIELSEEDYILSFIVLWSLTEKLLQDCFHPLKYYLTSVLYYVYYFNKDLFWKFFDKYCDVDFIKFAQYIFEHDQIPLFNHGYDFKDMILQYFISEFSVLYLYFDKERIELFLENIIFATKYKRDLFFEKRNFSLFYFMKNFVFLKDYVFAAEEKEVLDILKFDLNIKPEETERIQGFFYV